MLQLGYDTPVDHVGLTLTWSLPFTRLNPGLVLNAGNFREWSQPSLVIIIPAPPSNPSSNPTFSTSRSCQPSRCTLRPDSKQRLAQHDGLQGDARSDDAIAFSSSDGLVKSGEAEAVPNNADWTMKSGDFTNKSGDLMGYNEDNMGI